MSVTTKAFFFRSRSDGSRLSWSRRRSTLQDQLSLALPSSPIIEVATHLTSSQLSLLARGPNYVLPCQSRV
jgi:hypothetical protein